MPHHVYTGTSTGSLLAVYLATKGSTAAAVLPQVEAALEDERLRSQSEQAFEKFSALRAGADLQALPLQWLLRLV